MLVVAGKRAEAADGRGLGRQKRAGPQGIKAKRLKHTHMCAICGYFPNLFSFSLHKLAAG